MERGCQASALAPIKARYGGVVSALRDSRNNTRFRDETEAEADEEKADIDPAYASFAGDISYTPAFLRFGPLCQAAMAGHEPVHFVDSGATAAVDHYEHGPAYNTQSAADTVHCPSSYVSFAQHVFYGWDTRYGAGKPSA